MLGGIGGFGGLFDLKACGFKDPVLVAATDGVGTKLKLAIETGIHDGIGIDLVAMNVNDIVVQGAEPLFFLDYFASGKLDLGVAKTVIASIAKGCKEAGCALIGGETAEMPGLYAPGDYDLAGFAVGAVERSVVAAAEGHRRRRRHPRAAVLRRACQWLLSGAPRRRGDRVLSWNDPAPFAPGLTLGEALLTPTRIYVRQILETIRGSGAVKALAHITGGGLTDNIPRVLPEGLAAEIDLGAFALPPVFAWLQVEARLDQKEMLRTFNCGIGMILIVEPAGRRARARASRRRDESDRRDRRARPRRGGSLQGRACIGATGDEETCRRPHLGPGLSNLQALIEACRAPDLSRQDRPRGVERAERARTPARRGGSHSGADHQPQGLRLTRGLRRRPRRGAERGRRRASLQCRASCASIRKASCGAGGTVTSTSTPPSCLRSKVCTPTLAFWMKASRSPAAPCISCGPRWTAGPIVAQAAVPVLPGDTPDSLAARVLQAEHRLYPHALGLVASGAVHVEGEFVVGMTQIRDQAPFFSPPLDEAL